jgi:hypothetical protein
MSKWTVGVSPPERAVGVFELTRGSEETGASLGDAQGRVASG